VLALAAIHLAHARYPDDRSGYGLAKLEDGAGVVPLGRRSERFASGDTKEAATTQPRAAKEKISSKPLRVNPRIEPPGLNTPGLNTGLKT